MRLHCHPTGPMLAAKAFSKIKLVTIIMLIPHLVVSQKSGNLLPNETEVNQVNHFQDVVEPSIFIAILARNKAHTLPYFLQLLESLDYPKERISIWYVTKLINEKIFLHQKELTNFNQL